MLWCAGDYLNLVFPSFSVSGHVPVGLKVVCVTIVLFWV